MILMPAGTWGAEAGTTNAAEASLHSPLYALSLMGVGASGKPVRVAAETAPS